MAVPAASASPCYDGETPDAVARRLGVPRVVLYDRVSSTMDAAHALAASGTPAGTVVLADEQTAGRGRQGNSWRSAAGEGLWLTVVERPASSGGLDVLSLRVGLATAAALDRFAGEAVRVKWPNDLFVGDGKVGGVLVEARWRAGQPDWVAIGLGVNVRQPSDVPRASGLREGTSRLAALRAVVAAVLRAASRSGPLDRSELNEFTARDYAGGRQCVSPSVGTVAGVTAAGDLVVQTASGIRQHRTGSLVLEGDA